MVPKSQELFFRLLCVQSRSLSFVSKGSILGDFLM